MQFPASSAIRVARPFWEQLGQVSRDWKTVIQSTNTDADGRFSIVPKAKKRIYHLMISSNGFNPLVVHVRVSRWTKKLLDLRPEIST